MCQVLTSTATNVAHGDTSEFSRDFVVGAGPYPVPLPPAPTLKLDSFNVLRPLAIRSPIVTTRLTLPTPSTGPSPASPPTRALT